MGKRIQRISKFLMSFGIFAFLLAAAYVLLSCYNRNGGFGWLQYATINGGVSNPYLPPEWEIYGNDIYSSIQLAIYLACGAVGCLLWGVPVCWLGRLFEKVEDIESFLISDPVPIEKPQNKSSLT